MRSAPSAKRRPPGLHFDGGAFDIIYKELRAGGEAVIGAPTAKVAESHPSIGITAVAPPV
jgi:hypothetical protein